MPDVFTALSSALSAEGKSQVCYIKKKGDTALFLRVLYIVCSRRKTDPWNWEQDKLTLGTTPMAVSLTA